MSRHPRHQSVISRHSDDASSEDHWYLQLQKNLQKGAVQPRSQESVFDQINSIMNNNGRSKYTSVEAAVEDMKERSGLTAYLDKINKTSEEEISSAKTVTASDDNDFYKLLKYAAQAKNWYELGRLVGKADKDQGKVVNAAESMVFFHYYGDPELRDIKIPMNNWHVYTMGYGKGAGLSDDEKQRDYDFTSNFINAKLNKSAADSNNVLEKKVDVTPLVVKKHPPVLKTLENYVRDTKGNLPVPAIIDKIRSIHNSDCSDSKDWDDDKLIRLVSKLNLSAKRNNPASYENYNNLGARDSSSDADVDPSNTDAFFALNPAQQ